MLPTHRTSQAAARIRALTETAADLFLERGYEGVSVDELIDRVGGSRRNVYGRFGGKQGLFIEVITQLCDEQAEPLRILDVGDGEIGPALITFGENLLAAVLHPRTLALHRLMVSEGRRFPELSQAILRSGHEAGIRILAEWLSLRRTELRADLSPEALAEQFVTLLTASAQLRALVGTESMPRSSDEISRLARETVSTFLHGARRADRSLHA